MCGRSFPRSLPVCVGFCGKNTRPSPCVMRRAGSWSARQWIFHCGRYWAPTSRSARRKAWHQRESLIFTKDEMQGFDAGMTDSLLAEGLKSLCCVPLLRPKDPLGVLVLGSTRADAFKNDDLTLLNQVAAQLAIAIEHRK